MKIWFQALSQNAEKDPFWRAYDEACLRYVPSLARPDTHIHFASTDKRAPKMVLSSYVKYLHLAQVIENALHAEKQGYDVFVIGGVGDLGYAELQEVLDIPVVFIGQTAFLTATLLGAKFAVVNSDQRALQSSGEMARRYGLDANMVEGSHVGQSQNDHFTLMSTDPQRAVADIRTAARGPIDRGASMLIPGTAPISVFLAEQGVRDIDGVPVLDLHIAVVKAAEMLVDFRRLGMKKARKGPGLEVSKKDVLLARKVYGIGE